MTELLVIGNGFDLACGLESSYSDYFKSTFEAKKEDGVLKQIYGSFNFQSTTNCYVDNNKEEYHTLLVDPSGMSNSICFWDLLLFYYGYECSKVGRVWTTWKDVEQVMFQFLEGEKSSNPFNSSLFKALNKIASDEKIKAEKTNAKISVIPGSVVDKSIYKDKEELNMLAACLYLPTERRCYGLKIEDLLLHERKQFELNFIEYLSGKITPIYENNSQILFNALKDEEKKTYILSFNYTDPIRNENVHLNNIHGTLKNKNIVFGIDSQHYGEKFNEEINSDKFTKSYRVLVNKGESWKLPPVSTTKAIKFYGHSLGEADYSYFRAIFDYFNIYDSEIELIFYYSDYISKGTGELIEQDEYMVTCVMNLLDSYGRTLPNLKGKNLTTKLSLENRLTIVNLDIQREDSGIITEIGIE